MNNRSIRVLLVDDEELLRCAVREWLEDEQFQITEAMSGADALELLSKESFDCGILDLHLIDMSGVEVLKTAQYAGESPAWVIMTGNLGEEAYQELRALGIADDAILQKPIFDMQVITSRFLSSVAS